MSALFTFWGLKLDLILTVKNTPIPNEFTYNSTFLESVSSNHYQNVGNRFYILRFENKEYQFFENETLLSGDILSQHQL